MILATDMERFRVSVLRSRKLSHKGETLIYQAIVFTEVLFTAFFALVFLFTQRPLSTKMELDQTFKI